MANVIVKVLGAPLKEVEADSVGELKEILELEGYAASVNGNPASDDFDLSDNQIVSLAKPVKGGLI